MRSGESDELSYVYDPGAVLDHVRSLLDGAVEVAAVSIPETFVGDIEAPLAAAMERDVLVLLLMYDARSAVEPIAPVAPIASIGRQTDRTVPMYCVVDDLHGLYADPRLLEADDPEHRATIVHSYDVAYALYGQFVGNHWQVGHEIYRPDPPSLPVEYDDIRRLVLTAYAHIREATRITAEVELAAWEARDAIEGPVINAKQSLLAPVNSTMPVQSTLVLRTETGRTTVGGAGGYLEDVNAVRGTIAEL